MRAGCVMDCLNIIAILFADESWMYDRLLEYYRNSVC